MITNWTSLPQRLRIRTSRLVTVTLIGIVSGLFQTIILVTLASVVASGDEENLTVPIVGISMSSTIALAGALVLIAPLVWLTYVNARIGSDLVRSHLIAVRGGWLDDYFGSRYDSRRSLPPGEASDRVLSFSSQTAQATFAISSLLTSVTNIAVLVGSAVLLQPVLALLMFGGAGLVSFVIGRPVAGRAKAASSRLAAESPQLSRRFVDFLTATKEIEAFDVGSAAVQDLSPRIESTALLSARISFWSRFGPTFSQYMILGMLLITLLVVETFGALGGNSLAVLLVVVRSSTYVQAIQRGTQSLLTVLPMLDSIEQLASSFEPRQVSSQQPGDSVRTQGPVLQLTSVQYQYPGAAQLALNNLSMAVYPGEIVGLIGPSGSGKSTAIDLVLGLIKPTSGVISRDGRDPYTSDRGSCAYVPQSPLLIPATAAENIRFLRSWVSDDDVALAYQDAQLSSSMLSEGLATVISQTDAMMSGGQRQRLALARALAGHPRLLLLDEPTSALDTETKTMILATIESLRAEAATLIVTHDPDAAAICDRVIDLGNCFGVEQ